MFDFSVIISKNSNIQPTFAEEVRFNYIDKNYIKEDIYRGNHFFIRTFGHIDQDQPYYYKNQNIHYFIMGNVYTNQNYTSLKNTKVSRLYPQDLEYFYSNFDLDFLKYIKGIFIILIFDENKNNYFFINSRSGLLDTYYYSSKKYLMASTSVESIIK